MALREGIDEGKLYIHNGRNCDEFPPGAGSLASTPVASITTVGGDRLSTEIECSGCS
jgi:hypothetical protein